MFTTTDLAMADSINPILKDLFDCFRPYYSNSGMNFSLEVLKCFWIVCITFTVHRSLKKKIPWCQIATPWKPSYTTISADYLILETKCCSCLEFQFQTQSINFERYSSPLNVTAPKST